MKRVHDARALETPPTLSTMGFELIHAPTTLSYDEFLDDDKVRAVYYAEAALAIEAITGARRVVAIRELGSVDGFCSCPLLCILNHLPISSGFVAGRFLQITWCVHRSPVPKTLRQAPATAIIPPSTP
jgi:hypothetical protein